MMAIRIEATKVSLFTCRVDLKLEVNSVPKISNSFKELYKNKILLHVYFDTTNLRGW